MMLPDYRLDPPQGSDLLAELGIRHGLVRELAEDARAMRCPERAAVFPAYGFAGLSPEPALEPGLAEPSEPWDPAPSLPPADQR